MHSRPSIHLNILIHISVVEVTIFAQQNIKTDNNLLLFCVVLSQQQLVDILFPHYNIIISLLYFVKSSRVCSWTIEASKSNRSKLGNLLNTYNNYTFSVPGHWKKLCMRFANILYIFLSIYLYLYRLYN